MATTPAEPTARPPKKSTARQIQLRYRKHSDEKERDYLVTLDLPEPSSDDAKRPFVQLSESAIKGLGPFVRPVHPSIIAVLSTMKQEARKRNQARQHGEAKPSTSTASPSLPSLYPRPRSAPRANVSKMIR